MKPRVFLSILALSCGMVFPVMPVVASGPQIAAVVNEDAITQKDLDDRVRLIMASSGMPSRADIRQKLEPQVMNALIEEQIMMQEARRLKLEVPQEEIEKGFADLAKQNKMSAENFKAMLQKGGLPLSTLQRQIKAHLSWTMVVQERLRPRITITEREVDEVLARLSKNVGRAEYLLAEIFLPIDNAKAEAKVMQLASSLVSEIKAGRASFFKLAQQFSKSAGSANGGDLGWIPEDQLPEDVAGGVKALEVNQVSAPIRSSSGVHVMFLREKRQLTVEKMPNRDKIFNVLGMERLDRMQRGYMLDLKASAFIDVRVGS